MYGITKLLPPQEFGRTRDLIVSDLQQESRHSFYPFLRTQPMPSLARFLMVVGIIGGIVYAGVFALATFVDPKPREISIPVPQDRFYKQQK